MTRNLLLFSFVLWQLPAPLAAQGEAEALVRKALDAAGGSAAHAQVHAVHTKLKGILHEAEGAAFTAEVATEGLDRYRSVLHTELQNLRLTMVTVLNGKELWVKVNDAPEPIPPGSMESYRRILYVDHVGSLLPLLKDKAFQLTALGESKKDGLAVLGVKVARKDHADVLLFFDKEKGFLVRKEYRGLGENGKEGDHVAVYTDYQELPPAAAEEALLKGAKVGTDGPSLLEFLRKRTLTPAARDRLAALARRLGAEGFAEREEAARELIAAGSAAVPFLAQAAKSTDAEIAQRARECLEKVKGDQDAGLMTAVVRLLALRKPAGAAEALLALLPAAAEEKLAREVRFALAAVAVREGQPEKVLVAALEDKDPVRRAAALAALGKDGGALAKEPGRRLFLANLKVPMRVSEYRDGKKSIEWQRLEVSHFTRFDDAVFAKP